LLLTLIATPVVYSLLDDLRHTTQWRILAGRAAGLRRRVGSRRRVREAPAEENGVVPEDKVEHIGAAGD
jgi:hypothetical protein